MKMRTKEGKTVKIYQTSEHRLTADVLAAVGGFLDVYTFLARGCVFANAQTGNIVLLAASLTGGDPARVLSYLAPVTAFVIGIIICETIRSRVKESRDIKTHWRQIVLAVEVIGLTVAAFMPAGKGNFAANMLISFVCAMQMEAFRKVQGVAYVSTMCTGNLRSATAHLYSWKKNRDEKSLEKSLRYFKVILWFAIGAAAGALITPFIGEKAVLLAAAILMMIIILMRKEYIVR